jgi:hypothetical protein
MGTPSKNAGPIPAALDSGRKSVERVHNRLDALEAKGVAEALV